MIPDVSCRVILAICLLGAVARCSAEDAASPAESLPGMPGFTADSLAIPEILPGAEECSGIDAGLLSCCGGLHPESCEDTCRVYLAKVLGTSFVNLRTSAVQAAAPPPGMSAVWNSPTSNNGSLFTAALAGGVKVPLACGAVRFECEGALRDNFNQASTPTNQTAISVWANDNWTALGNIWGDVKLTRRIGAYAGGGVGSGGYWLQALGPSGSVASNQAAVFAWQAGGGAVWRYNALVDLDVSYRFLDFGQIDATLSQPGVGNLGTVSSKMSAGQVFFMLRVYEPFQWRKHLRNRAFYLPE